MLCVPVRTDEQAKQAFAMGADLVEWNFSDHKLLCGPGIRWIDRDWKSSLPCDIVSYHNFEETPDLEPLLRRLRQKPARFYKIATMARTSIDALRMIAFTRLHPDLIGLCMGDDGKISRLLGSSPIKYAALSEEEATAPGQLLLTEMIRRPIVVDGLIGDPVAQSIGHLYHDHYFKMRVPASELAAFFAYPFFRGLSVTMPHKETVIPYLNELDPTADAIGAVNTILFAGGKKIGFNTDGEGAVAALGDVAGKRLLLLGAGGSAKAIAYTACQQGAKVSIMNRTPARAEALAQKLHCRTGFFPYDIVVNTVPGDTSVEILPGTTVMDIVFHESGLLKRAQERGCRCIPAKEMFFHQAKMQRRIWENPYQNDRGWRD